MVMITCPLSLGELVDKLSILQIKKCHIHQDPRKRKLVDREERSLSEILGSLNLEGIEGHLENLEAINATLWKIEDDIRAKEAASEFDEEFIRLARSVYKTNDRRFLLKREINEHYGSTLQEVKFHPDSQL